MPVWIEACDNVSLTNIYDKGERTQLNLLVETEIFAEYIFTKFHNISMENVTSLYWFAGIYYTYKCVCLSKEEYVP